MKLTVEELEARSQWARWISGVIAGPGDFPPPNSGHLGDGALLAAAKTLQSCHPSTEQAIRIESERVRLFVNAPGGVPAPPYGSWWIEGTLEGKTTERVAVRYLSEGLQRQLRTGPADYLPTELEFLSFLLHHQRAARMTDAREFELESLDRERDFVQTQMVPWIPRFCEAGRSATREPYWRSIFDFVEGFVRSESVRVA